MKYFEMLICIAFIAILAHSSSMRVKQRERAKDGCIYVYKDCNYEGVRYEICSDQTDFSAINFKDQVSSISLGKGVNVMLFQEPNFRGENFLVMADESCFPYNPSLSKFNDKLNSLKIINIMPNRPLKGCVRIFSACDFKGPSYEFCQDRPEFPKKDFPSDTVSSVWVGSETEVELFSRDGKKKSFSEDFACFVTCLGLMTNQIQSANIYTVTRSRQVYTDEVKQKIEEEKKREEERLKEEATEQFFSIIYASYGDLDVTSKVKTYVNPWRHSLTFSAFKDSFGSTLPNVLKTSHLFYFAKGKICLTSAKDQEILDVNVYSNNNCYELNYTTLNLKIFAAMYGGRDITNILRNLAKEKDFRYIEVNSSLYGDPLPGWKKALSVFYEVDGIKIALTRVDGDKIDVRSEAKKKEDYEEEKKKREEEERIRKEKEAKEEEERKKKQEEEKRQKEEAERQKKEKEKKMFSIIDASYGPYFVTDQVLTHVVNNGINYAIYPEFQVLPSGFLKMSTVFYWASNKLCFRTITDKSTVFLSQSSNEMEYCHEEPPTDTKIQIYLATYGGVDVTSVIRQNSKDKNFSSVTATKEEFGNTLPGWKSVLMVYFKVGDTYTTKLVSEGSKVVFEEEIERKKQEEKDKNEKEKKAAEDAKKIAENQKLIFSIGGVSFGPQIFTDLVSNNLKKNGGDSVSINPSSLYFGDSWEGVRKTNHVFYWKNNNICTVVAIEGMMPFVINRNGFSEPGSCYSAPQPKSPSDILILGAAYGSLDVTIKLRQIISSIGLTQFEVNDKFFGIENQVDGLTLKTLSVYFKIQDIYYFIVAQGGKKVDFVQEQKDYEKKNVVDKTEESRAYIIQANYGYLDITDRVTNLVKNSSTTKVTFYASDYYFGDPAPYQYKTAGVIYTIKNQYCVTAAKEDQKMEISESLSQCYSKPDATSTVRIYAAAYAGYDVTDKLRHLALSSTFKSLTVNDDLLKEPINSSYVKALIIYYELDGQFYHYIYKYSEIIDFKNNEDKRRETEIKDGTYFTITHASYGPLQVTNKVIDMVNKTQYSLSFKAENNVFGDTWTGNTPKFSHVFYLLHNQICVANASEFEGVSIGIDKPSNCHEQPNVTKSGIKIEAASWGAKDVTEFLRIKSNESGFGTVYAEDSYFGDPLKTLSIQFSINGQRYSKVFREHEAVNLIELTKTLSSIQTQTQEATSTYIKVIKTQQEIEQTKQATITQVQTEIKQKEEMSKKVESSTNTTIQSTIQAIQQTSKEAEEKIRIENRNKEIKVNQNYIDTNYLSKINFSTEKGTVIPSNAIVSLVGINSGNKLFFGDNGKGEIGVSGITPTSVADGTFWTIKSSVSNSIKTLDKVQLLTYNNRALYSNNDSASMINNEGYKVTTTDNLSDDRAFWKVMRVRNYGANDDENLKVGDIIWLFNTGAGTLAMSKSKTQDPLSVILARQITSNDNPQNDSDKSILFVFTGFQLPKPTNSQRRN